MMNSVALLINVLSAVAPVLNSWGISISQPIMINTNGSLKGFLGELSSYDSQPYSSDDKIEALLDEMKKPSVDPVVLYFDGTFRGETRLKRMMGVIKTGQYLGKRIRRLPVIVIDCPLKNEFLPDVFYIDLQKNIQHDIDFWEIIPEEDFLELVHEKIFELSDEMGEGKRFLKGAACFCYPYFKKKADMAGYEQLHRDVENLVELNEQGKDNYGLSSQFVKELYAYRQNDKKLPLLTLPNVNTVVSDSEREYMFHDVKYVYMSNTLFNAVIEGMRHVIGPTRLKEILVEDGFLIKGAGKGFTSKMPYYDQYGRFRRVDALRFDLEKLQRPGKVDFITEFGGESYE